MGQGIRCPREIAVMEIVTYEDTIATPLQAHVSAVETELAKHVQNWEEKI